MVRSTISGEAKDTKSSVAAVTLGPDRGNVPKTDQVLKAHPAGRHSP